MRTRKFLALALALCIALALLPTAALAAEQPEAGIRDMRSYFWTQHKQDEPEPNAPVFGGGAFGIFYEDSTEYLTYSSFNLYDVKSVAHFILYDNGELYLSRTTEPTKGSFHKIMDNVKEIEKVTLPTYLLHEKNQYSQNFGTAGWGQYSTGSYHDYVNTVDLTTILTESGDLYVMGVPQAIPEEYMSLSYVQTRGNGSYGSYRYRSSVTAESLFPLDFADYADEQEDAVLIAEGIAHIMPGYGYSITLSNKSGSSSPTSYTDKRSDGFYMTTDGACYAGFPIEGSNPKHLASNVVNYLPSSDIQLLEDGTLQKAGRTVARDVKDFNSRYYLTNDGVVYDYDSKRIGSNVAQLTGTGDFSGYNSETMEDGSTVYLMSGEGLFIQEDDSLWVYNWSDKRAEKVMEDVGAVYSGYVVRTNGDVYRVELEGSFRKLFSGNGYAPDPTPAIHAGKIFKDASSWALVDLRDARGSGLTIPTDGLSYNQPITREKFCEVSVKLYEALSGKKATAATENPFADTKNPEILKAYALGIVKGTGDRQFSPNAKIDRESIAVMLQRTVDAAGSSLKKGSAVSFADAGTISGWAKSSVDAMAKANVIRGVGSNRFDPKGTVTVEQAIIMANRIVS